MSETMRRKPCSSIDLRLAGLSRGSALGWAGAPEGALNGQRNAKVSIPLNRRFGAGTAAGGKIWHKKIPHGGIFLCFGNVRLGTRVAPQLPGAPRIRQESLRFPFPPEARKSPWIRERANPHGACPIKRALTTAPHWPANSPSAAASSRLPARLRQSPPPLRFSFRPSRQTASRRSRKTARRQLSAPLTIARRPRRGVSRRNEAADARIPGVRRPLIRPHSTVKPNSSTLVPNHFS